MGYHQKEHHWHEYVEFERCFGGQRTVWRRVYLGYW
jgi:hypothetical protein